MDNERFCKAWDIRRSGKKLNLLYIFRYTGKTIRSCHQFHNFDNHLLFYERSFTQIKLTANMHLYHVQANIHISRSRTMYHRHANTLFFFFFQTSTDFFRFSKISLHTDITIHNLPDLKRCSSYYMSICEGASFSLRFIMRYDVTKIYIYLFFFIMSPFWENRKKGQTCKIGLLVSDTFGYVFEYVYK